MPSCGPRGAPRSSTRALSYLRRPWKLMRRSSRKLAVIRMGDDRWDADFVGGVARRVVKLLAEARHDSPLPRLMSVAEVSLEYGLSADWIYSHADQLDVIRIG